MNPESPILNGRISIPLGINHPDTFNSVILPRKLEDWAQALGEGRREDDCLLVTWKKVDEKDDRVSLHLCAGSIQGRPAQRDNALTIVFDEQALNGLIMIFVLLRTVLSDRRGEEPLSLRSAPDKYLALPLGVDTQGGWISENSINLPEDLEKWADDLHEAHEYPGEPLEDHHLVITWFYVGDEDHQVALGLQAGPKMEGTTEDHSNNKLDICLDEQGLGDLITVFTRLRNALRSNRKR